MSPTDVRKAIIPAAGRGTRMRPFSRLVPKELVPLGTRPALELVMEEAAAAGIREVGLVVNPGKELLHRFLDSLADHPTLHELRVETIEQREATGLADALLCCQDYLDGDPFALLLPDNVLLSPDYRLADMLDLYRTSGLDVLGVIDVDHRLSGHYGDSGRIDSEPLEGNALAIHRLHGKGPGRLEVEPGEVVLRSCGRFVCDPDFVEVLAEVRPQVEGECSEVPAYQKLIARRGARGLRLPQPLFDVGYPRGYLAASAWLHRLAESEHARD